jgi:hypothetical protein
MPHRMYQWDICVCFRPQHSRNSPQIISFVTAALYSAIWLRRWMYGARSNMWHRIGWFSGLVCSGSVVGAIAWTAALQSHDVQYRANAAGVSRQQQLSLSATSSRWHAVFVVLYGFEFLCMIVPKLMMLGRLKDSTLRGSRSQSGAIVNVGKFELFGLRVLQNVFILISAAILLCSMVGTVAYAVACVFNLQLAARYDLASAACDDQGNDTNSSIALFQEAIPVLADSFNAQALQSYVEATALLFITVAYGMLLPMNVSVFRAAESAAAHALATASNKRRKSDGAEATISIVDETMHGAVLQRRWLIAACVVVFITFPARAAFGVLNAYSQLNSSLNTMCGVCESCQSDPWLISVWLNYTPEFQPIVVGLSSPLPLSVSLWLITAARANFLKAQADLVAAGIIRVRLGENYPLARP